MDKTHDLVLGAGGVKGYLEIGALRAIEELQIPIGTVTGVSVGAGNAALFTNGFTSEQILKVFKQGRGRMYDPTMMLRAFTIPDFAQWLVSQSCISLVGPWTDVVRELGLVSNDRLQILAYDIANHVPVLFKGADMDLPKAIAASGSVPGVFVPVRHQGGLLVDGALYHYNPTEFSRTPAIVVRLKRATRWPDEPMSPMDTYYHWRELNLPLTPSMQSIDEVNNIVIDMESDDVSGLSFGISEAKCMQLVEKGYRTAMAVLTKAIADGRIHGTIPGVASSQEA